MEGLGTWSSSTGTQGRRRSHLEDQLDRLLDQPVEFLNSTGQASTRSSWEVKRIGIRIEVSDTGNDQFQHLVEQILACGVRHELLPEVDKQRHHLPSSKVLNRKTKAVFVSSSSSSSSGYFESIRDVYWENPAVRGEIISVYIYV
ncbi:unnamed protein product [Microthlaspi erraticum]|uniref:Fucosyltransferase n=1 Tax=Microthlaspi erraticum TaxID=1685480 RepID=A0A6D2J6X8_9BRAS|nr:unnamed protein product [Microthlaspi erraticum]